MQKPQKTKKSNQIQKSNKYDIQLRIPRPKGLTNTIHNLHLKYGTNNIKPHLKQIKKIIIEQWILSSYMLNGETISIDQLALYLGLTRDKLQKYTNNIYLRIATSFDKDRQGIQEKARVLFAQALKMGTETMALTSHQTGILLASQANEYKPFMSRDVNGAIANQIAAQKPILELLRMIQEKKSDILTPTLIPDNPSQATKSAITSDMAIKMIRDNTHSVLEEPGSLKGLLTESLPDINPNTQNLSQIQIPVVLNNNATEEEDKKARKGQFAHGRREAIQDIDEDLEDFKA